MPNEIQLTESQIAAGKTVIELEPSGCIAFRVDTANWSLNKIDSVTITSPYQTKTISHNFESAGFHIEPY